MSNFTAEALKDYIRKYKYTMAIWTDRADFITDADESLCEDKLLELRCFDENGEFFAHRDNPFKDYLFREITDDRTYGEGFFDEAQYLDIDESRSKNKDCVLATGGGRYHLPKGITAKMLLVRIFFKYDKDGVAHKFDWRPVGFTDEETIGKGE